MNQHSRNSLCKFILSHPFVRFSRPTSSIRSTCLPQIPNHLVSDSVPSLPASKIHYFRPPNGSYSSTQFIYRVITRKYSNEPASGLDKDKVVDEINLKFAEAREEIEMALESKETVYFDEEASCARDAVKEVVEMFEGLLKKLPESDRGAVQRSMGLKIEQLKAELEQLND